MHRIIIKELKYYIRHKNELIVLVNFFASISMLAAFSFPAESGIPHGMAASLFWIILFCVSSIIAATSWQRHAEQGEIASFQLLPWSLEWTVLGKWVAHYLIIILPAMVAVPITGAWMGMPAKSLLVSLIGLAAGGVALSAMQQLIAALMAGGQRTQGAALGIIALPFSIPIIIAGASYTAQTALWHGGLAFLMGYGFFLLPICCIAGAASLRASH